jgi:predicted dehydrogenase
VGERQGRRCAGLRALSTPIRIGILGAAKIAPPALIRPARQVDEVEVAAVAARDRARAERFAAKHGIPRVLDTYEDVVADPDIDAVYVPLPNGLHGRWTIAAVEAGKHVLCEKPFTANAEEARRVAAVAEGSDRVVMEAFHYRYHPMTERVLELLAEGAVGEVRHIDTWMAIPLLPPGDIRWNLGLAGGTLMDCCYPLHQQRTFAGAEPEVVSAAARLRSPGVDRFVTAALRYDDGRTGRITSSMLSRRLLSLGGRITGTEGELRLRNPVAPQYFGRVQIRSKGTTRTERADRRPSYLFQLRAFAGAVLRGEPFPTGVDDAVANMTAIDAVYRAAGLEPRQPTAS